MIEIEAIVRTWFIAFDGLYFNYCGILEDEFGRLYLRCGHKYTFLDSIEMVCIEKRWLEDECVRLVIEKNMRVRFVCVCARVDMYECYSCMHMWVQRIKIEEDRYVQHLVFYKMKENNLWVGF